MTELAIFVGALTIICLMTLAAVCYSYFRGLHQLIMERRLGYCHYDRFHVNTFYILTLFALFVGSSYVIGRIIILVLGAGGGE